MTGSSDLGSVVKRAIYVAARVGSRSECSIVGSSQFWSTVRLVTGFGQLVIGAPVGRVQSARGFVGCRTIGSRIGRARARKVDHAVDDRVRNRTIHQLPALRIPHQRDKRSRVYETL
jgi:hypothetical protein